MDRGQTVLPGQGASSPWSSASESKAGEVPRALALVQITQHLSDQLAAFPNPTNQTLHSELASLARETDTEIWAAGLLHLAGRLGDQGESQAALLLLGTLAQLPPELAKFVQPCIELARRRHEALLGEGDFGDRAEVLLSRFAQESTDPATLASFVVGGTVYKATRGALLARLASGPASFLSRGAGLRLLAAGGAFGAELPAFVLASKLGHQLSGAPQDWSRQALQGEVLAAGVTLFFLKSAGALAHGSVEKLHATPGLARAAAKILPDTAMFAGILAGHRAEVGLGLRPAESGSRELLNAFSTLLQFKVGGRLSDGLLGSAYHRGMRELDQRLKAAPWPAGLRWTELALEGGPGSKLAFPSFQMSSINDDGGNGNGNGRKNGDSKVVELFPNGNGRKTPTPPELKPMDVEAQDRLRGQLANRAENLLNEIAGTFGKFLSGVEMYAGFLERGDSETPRSIELDKKLLGAHHTFLEQHFEARSLHRDLTTFSFGLTTSRIVHENLRTRLRELTDSSEKLIRSFETVLGKLEKGDPAAALRGLHEWYKHTPFFLLFERSHVLDFSRDSAELTRASRLLGMAYGSLGRDVIRDPSDQSPYQLQIEMKKLLENLARDQNRELSRLVLSRFYPESPSVAPTPREGLAVGGSYREPFRGWLSLHLPALLLHHQGHVKAVERSMTPMEFFMDKATVRSGRETLQWLGYALSRQGEPRSWARDAAPKSPAERALRMSKEYDPSPERAARHLGKAGPRAILTHSLHAFMRSPHDPAVTMRTAMLAPEEIRHEVVALSGALSGAYLGRGAFNHWTYLGALREAFPNREIGVSMFRNWEALVLKLPLVQVARPQLAERKAPRLQMLRSAESLASGHPEWIAFQDGFFERQTEIEIRFLETVKGSAEFLTRPAEEIKKAEWPTFRESLSADLKKIDGTVRDLRKFFQEGSGRLASNGFPSSLSQPPWQELEGRLGRIEGALKIYRRFLAMVRFTGGQIEGSPTSEELKPVQDKLLELIGAFDAPEGTSYEGSLAMHWMAEPRAKIEMARMKVPVLAYIRASDLVEETPPNSQERPVTMDWVKNFASNMTASAARQRVFKFWTEWAQAKGIELKESEVQSFEQGLKRFPEYFFGELSYQAAINPFLAKALMIRLNVVPAGSALRNDIEVREALSERAVDKIPKNELEELKEGIIAHYEIQAGHFFPETYRDLSPAEKAEWGSRIDALPPILAKAINQPGIQTAQFFLLAHELGLSKLGVPASSQIQ